MARQRKRRSATGNFVVYGVLLPGTLLGIALSLAGLWGAEEWRLDLVSHFRMQYCLLLSVCGLLLIMLRARVLALLAIGFAVWNATLFVSWPQPPQLREGNVYKAVAFNMKAHNKAVEQMQAWIEHENPDLLVLIEATHTQRKLYNALGTLYPHRIDRLTGGGFGMVLLSKYPAELMRGSSWPGVGSNPFRVELPEGPLTLVGFHPQAPVGEKAWEWRNRSLRDLARYCREQDGPLLALGDMNCSPWSPFYQKFIEESGLHPPNVRWLPRRTWPSDFMPLWIPIDQFFISDHIQPIAEWTGAPCGSDHYPIVLLFRVVQAEE